jgi:hypothetical protein
MWGEGMKLKKSFIFLMVFVMLTATVAKASAPFNTGNISSTIKELTADKYQGRLSGDTGENLAAEYISNYFKSIG